MNYYYEKVCKSERNETETKNIRKIFDYDRKKLKKKNKVIEEKKIVHVSIEGDREGFNEAVNIPDESCNVEEDVIRKMLLEQLDACLDMLDPIEREEILARYDKDVSFAKYAESRGIPRTTLDDKTDKTIEKLRKMMGVKIMKK